MTQDSIRCSCHCMCANKQRAVAASFQRRNVTAPGVAQHVGCSTLQLLRNKALETPRTSGAVAVNNNYLGGACSLAPAHRCINLCRIKPASFFVKWRTAIHLIPNRDPGNAFHVAENHNAHKHKDLLSLSYPDPWNCIGDFGRRRQCNLMILVRQPPVWFDISQLRSKLVRQLSVQNRAHERRPVPQNQE